MERNDTEIAWFLAGFVLTIGVCLIIVLYVPGSGVISSEVQINALISLCFFVSILMVANLWKNKRDRQKSSLDEVDRLEKVNRFDTPPPLKHGVFSATFYKNTKGC